MNRRKYGINLDDGVALETKEELDKLFVDIRPETFQEISAWLNASEQDAVLFAGQIGTGKTTLLNRVIFDFASGHSDEVIIRIHFDTGYSISTDGGFVLLLFGNILQKCLNANLEITDCGLIIDDFSELGCSNWNSVAEKLTNRPKSLADSDRITVFSTRITQNANHFRNACRFLLNRLKSKLNKNPILIAEGIDKFEPHTSDYSALLETLHFLSEFKTLFEVNAVHFFYDADFKVGIKRIFLTSVPEEKLVLMLSKRLGVYAEQYKEAFDNIVKLSGGNLRQALRLLGGYYFFRSVHKSNEEAIANACYRVLVDMLSGSKDMAFEFLEPFYRDGYIEDGIMSNRRSNAQITELIYRNLIFLTSLPTNKMISRWPLLVNPLLKLTMENIVKSTPESIENKIFSTIASAQAFNPTGLNALTDEKGEPDWKSSWKYLMSVREYPLSIQQLLEEIASGLFGNERQDRIVIAFQSHDITKVLRDLLVGKANTYGVFDCHEIIADGGEGKNPVLNLIRETDEPDNDSTIYSVDMTGDWTENQLRELDHRRDLFAQLQMLWWIPTEKLEIYKAQWPQLRQLFRFYRLEKDILSGLIADEIKNDMEIIQEISSDNDNALNQLKKVLEYIQENEAAHG
jgi:hypothetical protein